MSAKAESPVAKLQIIPKPPLGCALLMMDLFRAYLHTSRLPLTHQREAIAMTLFESDRHLSVDDLAEILRERGEHVGKATIYRTLSLMVEAGLARELDFGEGFRRYEHQAGESRHDHLICTECGTVERLSGPILDDVLAELAGKVGFTVDSRRLKIYGICARCREGAEAQRQSSEAADMKVPAGVGVGRG